MIPGTFGTTSGKILELTFGVDFWIPYSRKFLLIFEPLVHRDWDLRYGAYFSGLGGYPERVQTKETLKETSKSNWWSQGDRVTDGDRVTLVTRSLGSRVWGLGSRV